MNLTSQRPRRQAVNNVHNRHRLVTTMLPIGLLLLSSFHMVSAASRRLSVEKGFNPWGILTRKLAKLANRNKISESTLFVEQHVSPATLTDFSLESNVKLVNDVALWNEGRQVPKIIIMGGPASGKGTQCERIAAMYGVVHLSTGDILRDAVQRDSEHGIGAIAKVFMDAGKLVPDDLMIEMVLERISQPDCQQRGWVLDGFPRTPAQADALAKKGITADLFVFLNVPDKDLVQRVIGRRLDPVTGKIYHLKFFPPPKDIIGRLVQRSDDTVGKVQSRLEQFHANVAAVRRRYDNLVEIDGSGNVDIVTQRLMEAINSRRKKVRYS